MSPINNSHRNCGAWEMGASRYSKFFFSCVYSMITKAKVYELVFYLFIEIESFYIFLAHGRREALPAVEEVRLSRVTWELFTFIWKQAKNLTKLVMIQERRDSRKQRKLFNHPNTHKQIGLKEKSDGERGKKQKSGNIREKVPNNHP